MTTLLATPEAPQVNPGTRFDLPDQEIRRRTGELLSQLDPVDGQYLGTIVQPDSPMFDAVASLEHEVFEAAFQGNDTVYMEQKYGPLTDSSRFLVVIEKDEGQDRQGRQGRPIAFMRIVAPTEDASSTLSIDDAAAQINKTPQEIRQAHGITDLSRCWDVATMGVLPKYHNTMASIDARLLLHKMFLRLAADENIEHMVAIIDQKALDGLRLVGTPLVPMCDVEAEFDDSHAFAFDSSEKSYAVYGHVPDFLASVGKRYDELRMQAEANAGIALLRRVVGSLLVADQTDRQITWPSDIQAVTS